MASTVLYPPIVDGYMPAFEVFPDDYSLQENIANNVCKVRFNFSKYNSSTDVKYAHVSVIRQSSGQSAVKALPGTSDEEKKAHPHRATGIILDVPIETEYDDYGNLLYHYVTIPDEDLNGVYGNYTGWVPGELYKIQLRFSFVSYQETGMGSMGQSAWLVKNAGEFSEWSTICVVKSIGEKYAEITTLRLSTDDTVTYKSNGEYEDPFIIYGSEFRAIYHSVIDSDNEGLYSYSVKLTDKDGSTVLDDSGIQYTYQNVNPNEMKYTFKTNILDGSSYRIELVYETINGYAEIVSVPVASEVPAVAATTLKLITAENDPDGVMDSTVFMEDEDGRVCLLVSGVEEAETASGIYYIRRTSSKSNFTIWEDIKKIDLSGLTTVDKVFYDYTLESGVFYKYGLQLVDSKGDRGSLAITENPVYRDFNYSFLLGENNQQLRLAFNNTVDNYKINISDSVNTTIGGQYPFITRNGNMRYRTIPVNGLISFNMDENNLFLTDKDIYKYDNIVDMYAARRGVNIKDTDTSMYRRASNMYDMTYERDFRNKVLEFLHNGRPKLFKSATEGNILVRLVDINCSPVQGLNRLIYSFSATGHEIADAGEEVLSKYNIAVLDGGAGATPAGDGTIHSHKLG